MSEKIRVFILTQNEPFYIPKVIRYLLDHQGEDYEIVGVTVLSPHRKNKTMLDWFKERARIYTLRELFLTGSAVVLCMLHHKFSKAAKKGRFSVRDLLTYRSVSFMETKDVNAPGYVEKLRKLNLDVILSISPPHIFKAGLLSLPTLFSLNAHGTLLPRHRGVFGSWWTLYCGDREAGATIHTMELRLDAGEIVWQKAFLVKSDDTQYSIAYGTKKLLAEGLVETLQAVRNDIVQFMQKRYEESYHRAPTQEEGRNFHHQGYRVIALRDYRYILASQFDGGEQL